MTIYYKLFNNFMLNMYDLGDIKKEDALAQGYKTATTRPDDGKQYYAKSFYESEAHIEVKWEEIPIPVSEAEE